MRMIASVGLVLALCLTVVLQVDMARAVYPGDQIAYQSLYEAYPQLLNAVPAVATNTALPPDAVLVEENDTCRVYMLPEPCLTFLTLEDATEHANATRPVVVPEFDPDMMIVPYSSLNDLREMQGLPRIDKAGNPVRSANKSKPGECRHKHKQKNRSSVQASSTGCANGGCARSSTRSTQRSNR